MIASFTRMPTNTNIYTVKIHIKWLNLLPIDVVKSAVNAEKQFQGLKALEASHELNRFSFSADTCTHKKKVFFAFSYLTLWFT